MSDPSPHSDLWVCMPCFLFPPDDRIGAIHVLNGTNGRVWCPWCGDAMEAVPNEYLTTEEIERIESLRAGEVDRR